MPRRSAVPKRAKTLKMLLDACLYGVRSSPFTRTKLGTCSLASAAARIPSGLEACTLSRAKAFISALGKGELEGRRGATTSQLLMIKT